MQTTKELQKTVIVLGMHRSGTSAITNVLNSSGLYCGDEKELLPNDQFNEKGYYERKEVVDLNEVILDQGFALASQNNANVSGELSRAALTGYGWVKGAWLPALAQILNKMEPERSLAEYVKNVYAQANGRHMVLKDPRLSLTLPVWQPHLGSTLIVMMIRDPDEVSRSLMERNELPDFVTQPLWTSYNQSALRVTTGCPRLLVNYHDLINSPKETVKKLFEFLDQNGIADVHDHFSDAVSSISSELYHSKPADIPSAYRASNNHAKNYYNNIVRNHISLEKEGELYEIDRDNLTTDYWLQLATTYISSMVMLDQTRNKLDQCRNNYAASINRLNSHPIAGLVIKTLRYLKRDRTFGNINPNENSSFKK